MAIRCFPLHPSQQAVLQDIYDFHPTMYDRPRVSCQLRMVGRRYLFPFTQTADTPEQSDTAEIDILRTLPAGKAHPRSMRGAHGLGFLLNGVLHGIFFSAHRPPP